MQGGCCRRIWIPCWIQNARATLHSRLDRLRCAFRGHHARFTDASVHPRAYGTFARVIGHYVREEKVIPLEEAIRKMTSLPATYLKLEGRGRIAEGAFADIVVFDANTIADHATFEDPHQYAVGVHHVLINGEHALRAGEHTGAFPGRALRRGGTERPETTR
ncbi:MAG: amidohydrolase family protein [Candidatus Limnocylindria bacterium]